MYYSCLDIKDFEEIPEPDAFTGQFSDFFLETYPLVFPKTYAQEVYNFFQFVAHPYRRCWDRPAKSPRNEEIESAIKNKGKEGSHTFLRDTGRFILHRMQEWMFKPTYEGRKHYYTSDRRMALPYFDVDCHKAFQTPLQRPEPPGRSLKRSFIAASALRRPSWEAAGARTAI